MRILFAAASESRLRYASSGGMERCLWNLLFAMSCKHHVEVVCRDLCDGPVEIAVRALGPLASENVALNAEGCTAEYSRRVEEIASAFDSVVAFNFPELLTQINYPITCLMFYDGWKLSSHSEHISHNFGFPARWMKEEFVSTTEGRRNRSFVLPMGVDIDKFCPLPRVINGPITLLFASVWHQGKGILEFLDICTSLSRTQCSFKALLVGSERLWDFGDRADGIFPDAQRLRIIERVEHASQNIPELEIIGEVEHDKMPIVYRSADLLVTPSRWRECLPLVVLESMSCGTPALAPRTGGYPEIIQNGKTGYLATLSVDDFAAQISQIVAAGGIPEPMKDRARTAIEGLSWTHVAAKLETILMHQVCGGTLGESDQM